MAQHYNSQGDFTLKKLDLINFDGSEKTSIVFAADRLVIEENLFAPCTRGYVDITDTNGMFIEFPIFGQETLEIAYTTDNENEKFPLIERSFRVYRVVSHGPKGVAGGSQYRLEFVSKEQIKNESLKVSKGYENKTTSDIVSDIFDTLDTTKTLAKSDSLHVQKIVVPFLKPFDAIGWLGSFSIHSKTDGSSYFFYEDQNGFNFKTLQELYQQEAIDTYSKVSQVMLPGNTPDDRGRYEAKKDRSINAMSMASYYDVLSSIGSGLYGSTLYTLDLTTRTYQKRLYSYPEAFEDMIHMEPGATFDNNGLVTADFDGLGSDSCRKFIVSSAAAANSSYVQAKDQENSLFPKRREESIQLRLSQLLQMDHIKATVEVPGDSRITAGCMVELNPQSYALTESGADPVDKYLKGKWLVRKVSHIIEDAQFRTIMEVCRDTIGTKRENVKTEAKLDNQQAKA